MLVELVVQGCNVLNERGTLLGIGANVCWCCASIAFIDGEIRGTPTKAGRHVRHTAILEDLPRQVEAMRDEANMFPFFFFF